MRGAPDIITRVVPLRPELPRQEYRKPLSLISVHFYHVPVGLSLVNIRLCGFLLHSAMCNSLPYAGCLISLTGKFPPPF
jgi:hypothetical protein